MHCCRSIILLFAATSTLWVSGPTSAQEFSFQQASVRVASDAPTSQTSEEPVTQQEIQKGVDELASHGELSDEERADLAASLKRSVEWLKTADEASRQADEFRQQIASAPQTIASLRAELEKPAPPPIRIAARDGWELSQLEAKTAEVEAQTNVDQEQLADINQRIDSRTTRVAAITKEIPETTKRIEESKHNDTVSHDGTFRDHVMGIERRARLQGLQAQLGRLQVEKQRFDALSQQWPLEHDAATRRLATSQRELSQWRKIVETWRRNESQRHAVATRRLAEKAHPALRDLATRNAEIAELRVSVSRSIESTSAEVTKLAKTRDELQANFDSLQSKVQHAAEATSTGILLRKQRDELPNWKESRRRRNRLSVDTPKAHLLLMELKDERREVADPDSHSDELILAMGERWKKYDQNEVKRAVMSLLQARRDLLDKLIADQDRLLRDLSELEVANQDLDQQVGEFRSYLDEHVLWVRSNSMLSVDDLTASAGAIVSILKPNQWVQAFRAVVGETMRRPAALAAAIAFLALAFVFRQRLVRRMEELCEPPTPGEPIGFGKSLPALAISALLSAGWPTVLLAIGYKLSTASGETEFTQGLGKSFFAVACLVWGCQLFREVCLEGHVGHRMFGWPPKVLVSVRRTLELAVLFGAPLIAVLFLTDSVAIPGGQSLHRLTFILTLSLVALQSYSLLRPRGPVMRAVTLLSPMSLVARFQRLIWVVAVAVPMALVAISCYGYHYSATQLSGRFAESLLAILGLIILHALALRWLRLKGYNGSLRAQQELAAAQQGDAVSDASVTTAEELAVKDEIDWRQTADIHIRELLRYAVVLTLFGGGWFIWSEVLPALGVLDRVALWDNMVQASETVSDPSGKTIVQHFETNVPTTLRDLLVAVLIVFLTLRVGNRLTSVLEVTLSDRLPIDRGARHAIAILVRYTATIAGLVTACWMIQLSWSSVQWMAAAMTVGLGFGLQEIFSNLVSGLIILFERPIRAGDVVTVGDVTGTVSRMQIRATTITDFDRRELIVPNRKFITDNVINWTLTDPICRAIVNVGVAYGTDTDMVSRILMSVSRRSPLVLDSPKACVVFGGFGDSTLDFELRVFIAHRDEMPEVVSELNLAINREFAQAGIEIAFPQQDLHIRSITNSQADVLIPPMAEQDRNAA